MGNPVTRSIFFLTPMAVLLIASGASAATLVDFESDPAPFNVLNGFTSSSSTEVHFSDTSGSDLVVVDVGGNHALAVMLDDDSGLLMEFDFVASALSLDFGNTLLANFGDTAVLTVYMGGFEVGNSVLALNGTNAIDQTISFSGASFDSAVFKYNVAGGLTELVDNISVTPAIPEPHAGLVFGMGALIVGAVCGRRRVIGLRPRGVHD